jgi:CBS domain-containing protein
MRISEIMHVHLPVLKPDSTFRDAVDKMDIYQFPALVVVDDERRPVGIFSEEIAWEVAKGRSLGEIAGYKVGQFAAAPELVAGLEDDVEDCRTRLLATVQPLLPVVAEGRLMGVALRTDILQALLVEATSPSSED